MSHNRPKTTFDRLLPGQAYSIKVVGESCAPDDSTGKYTTKDSRNCLYSRQARGKHFRLFMKKGPEMNQNDRKLI